MAGGKMKEYRPLPKKTESEQIRSEKKDVRRSNAPVQRDKKFYAPESRIGNGGRERRVYAKDVRMAYESESKKRRMSGHVK